MGRRLPQAEYSSAPRVSILMPVHDAAPFLEDCLASIRRQSWTDFEVVVVDDGSRDGSAEILDRCARRDSRFRVLHAGHRGLVQALNAGLEICRAPLVARMDADDVSHRRRIELQVQAFEEHPDLDVLSCLVWHFPRFAVGEGFRIYESWLNRLRSHGSIMRERFIESPLPHPSVMLRRRLLMDVGGYRDTGWPEDYDLWLRLAARGARFRKVERRLLFWRQHPDRLTHHDRRYRLEKFLQCKAHHLVRGPLSKAEIFVLWGAGQTGRRLSKHLGRLGRPPDACIDIDPLKIGRSMRGSPVLSPQELPRLLVSACRPVVLAAVASRGARRIIRRRLCGIGLEEGRDFWCVA